MKQNIIYFTIVLGTFLLCSGCGEDEEDEGPFFRHDDAVKLDIPVSGSLQNPAFSPDGDAIVLTRFRNGYNEEPADLVLFNLDDHSVHTLVSDGSANVNLPGSCWNAGAESIIFSSSREPHDEIYLIDDFGDPGDEIQITNRSEYMAYEPSFSPNGEWIVFESHPLDVEGQGVITKYKVDHSSTYIALTGNSEDCRQPNWSPSDNFIVYQKFENGQWDLWKIKPDGSSKSKVTSGEGDKTDASFTADGNFIIFSSDAEQDYANIYKIPVSGGNPVRLTEYDGYDGAPAISPDGSKLVFETYGGDPDDSEGTEIWLLEIN